MIQNDWATSMSFIGLFVGALVAGFCSDKFGRKVTIMVSIALNATFWIVQSYVPGYYAFVIFRILVQESDFHIKKIFWYLFSLSFMNCEGSAKSASLCITCRNSKIYKIVLVLQNFSFSAIFCLILWLSLNKAANQAAYLTYVCYACEVVGPKGRKTTGMIPNFTFTAGYLLDSGLSYAFPKWRDFTRVLGKIFIFLIFLGFLN